MQESQISVPSWIKPGFFIDIKDKQGDWRVAMILNVTKTQIRVRYDGWASKFDQNYMISSNNIKPFRSVIRGYTGQTESTPPPPRQHYKFTQEYHKQTFEHGLCKYMQSMYTKAQFDINQFIRGLHYTWVQYIMTQTYTSKEQIGLVYEYFFKHFQLVMLYLKEMNKCKNFQDWINGKVQNQQEICQGKRAFAQCYYEIFDSAYAIMDGYPRLKAFFKNNQALLNTFYSGYANHLQMMSDYLQNIAVVQLFEQSINKLMLTGKNSVICLSFVAAITRLFSAIQKTIKQKEKRKQLTQKVCQFILRQCIKMPEISVKQEEIWLQKIYSTCKMLLHKYQWKSDFLIKFEVININSWKCMILSEKLQRKVKGINNLKIFFCNVCNPQKRQNLMIFNTKQTIEQQIRKQDIFTAIFVENQHHQIIKKGCELAYQMYRQKSISMDELSVVWKSCRHRLEAVRKVVYIFFQQIAKDMRVQQISLLAQWIFAEELLEEIDKNFLYAFFRKVLNEATPEKCQVIKVLFQFIQLRLMQNRDQIRIYSQLLTMKKSIKLGFLETTINKFIELIPTQKTSELKLFYINLTNDVLSQCKNTTLQIENGSFNRIYKILCLQLRNKVPKANPQYEKKKQKVKGCLKILQFLQQLFDFQSHQFVQIWNLFTEQQNKELREQIFLSWILQISHTGILKIQSTQINRCLRQKTLKKQIFNKVFKNSQSIDYINMSQYEFKIFKRFLIQVNKDNMMLQEQTNFLSGIIYFRILNKMENIEGLQELFKIFINCRNQNVAKKAAQLIKELHLNYDTVKLQSAITTKVKKVEQLLSKIQKNIVDGIKKSNARKVRKFLYLLHNIATTVKQSQKIPEQYIVNLPYTRAPKRKVKILRDGHSRETEITNSTSIKHLKKLICQQFKILPYNTKLFKSIIQYKKIDEEGASFDQASANSSARSDDASKNSSAAHYRVVKKNVLQQIANQILWAPFSCLMMPENNSQIVVKQVQNNAYEIIQRFVNGEISQQLLKILADPQYFQKEASQLAYKILIQISCSNSSTLQILTNLINQLKSKKNIKPNTIGLADQSVNFRMYFCKNMSKLDGQQLKYFLNQQNIHIISQIFSQLSRQIIQGLQIDLLLQLITLIKKSLTLQPLPQHILDPQQIFKCILNILQFHLVVQQATQFKKQDKTQLHINQLSLLHQCLNILDNLFQKNYQKILQFIIKNQNFGKLMNLMYRGINRSQLGDQFQVRFDQYIKKVRQLSIQTQKIMFQVFIDSLYHSVLNNRKRKNTAFFRIIKNFIAVASPTAIQKLFGKPFSQNNLTFYQYCLQVIENQSDFISEPEKQNKVLSGHLLILQSLLKKNPKAINLKLCRTILYNCLCYNKQETIGRLKCISKNSIYAALQVIQLMAQTEQLFMKFIVSELRKYQQTQYWRTPQFWNVSLDAEIKSTTGFVGLENPGCICYLNSFTQTLFMNQQFRNSVKNFKCIDPSKDYSLLSQLRKLFLNLQHSNQKFLNPVPFTKTIKNTQDKPMIKIFEQMDIQEYSSILFDKIQKLLPKDQDFVKQIFGGTYSNDIISKQCNHCSTREESFLSMQVDVKPNLEESLKTLVKGELLEGENAYHCEKCNKKVRALKRMSIKKLPNYLIICLKRFEYNFETDQKFKVNSCCEFPRQLNLQPYSQQFLSTEQQLQQFRKLEQQSSEPEKVQKLSHQYFQYKLKGVIIHTGSSDSGHYYAILQSPNEADRWFQFNDNVVSDFDIENLADQAFGSDDPTYPKYKNAYMLVYERKKKIATVQEPKQQAIQQKQMQQVENLEQQIICRNRQIQTFQMMFTLEYQQFIIRLFLRSLCLNPEVYQDYKILNEKEGNQIPDSDPLLITKIYKKDCIQEVAKMFLQYCLFIKARQINIKYLCDVLKQLQKQLSTNSFLAVTNYLLHQLSQPQLVQQLFVEVSFKDKLIILSHFVCQVILTRMQRIKNNPNDNALVLVLRIVQNFANVMIKNGVCVNQLMYILRRIAQQHPQFIGYFEQMDMFDNIFSLLAGIDMGNQYKNSRLIKIKSDTNRIILQNSKYYKLAKKNQKNEEMDDEIQYSSSSYEIQGVKQFGKCVLKQQSPQQAWIFLYMLYKNQSELLKDYKEEDDDEQSVSDSVSQEQKQNEDRFQSHFQKMVRLRRGLFFNQLIKMKDTRIQLFLNECQGSKAASSLSLLLCQIAHQNQKFTDRLLGIIKKALKSLEATKFRSHLILLYYMIMHDDSLKNKKFQTIISILSKSLSENSQFFSEIDILHQWIIKIVLSSPEFSEVMVRTEEGIEFFTQVIDKVETQKKPNAQLMKKQRNPSYERLNYQVHGVIVSSQYEDYQKLYSMKRNFYNRLFHEQPLPLQLTNQIKSLSILQPNFEQLSRPIKSGDVILYMFLKKWSRILVKSNKFGMIKASKLIKDNDKKNLAGEDAASPFKKKNQQHKRNLIKVQGKQIDIGEDYKIASEQHLIWETDEKLRFIPVIQHTGSNQNPGQTKLQDIGMNSQTPEQKQSSNNEIEENSSVSYRSSSNT